MEFLFFVAPENQSKRGENDCIRDQKRELLRAGRSVYNQR